MSQLSTERKFGGTMANPMAMLPVAEKPKALEHWVLLPVVRKALQVRTMQDEKNILEKEFRNDFKNEEYEAWRKKVLASKLP